MKKFGFASLVTLSTLLLCSCALFAPKERTSLNDKVPQAFSLYSQTLDTTNRWWESFQSLELDELFTIKASMLWTEAARINIEYEITKEDGSLAATGYTVQLFSSATTGEPCFALPPLLEKQQERWKAGEFGGNE